MTMVSLYYIFLCLCDSETCSMLCQPWAKNQEALFIIIHLIMYVNIPIYKLNYGAYVHIELYN